MFMEGLPLIVDERLGHNAVFVFDDPWSLQPIFGQPVLGRPGISAARRPVIAGTTQAFGAIIAHHLAEAYRP